MELKEMKTTWEALSKKVENQEKLSRQMIRKMTERNYRSKLSKIAYSEYIGTVICYIGAAYLIMNFTKITSFTMQAFCILAILLLFALPVISLKSLKGIKAINIAAQSYSATLREYAHHKIRFLKLQQLNVSLGLSFMLIVVPVLSAIQGKDISQIPYFWILIFPISIAFFLAFAFWVLRSYKKIMDETEKMLSDIDN